jgi:hypothetical protein
MDYTSIGPVMAASMVCTLLEFKSNLFKARITSPNATKNIKRFTLKLLHNLKVTLMIITVSHKQKS